MGAMARNRSWPAVSQIWSLIVLPSTCTVLNLKSTPIVGRRAGVGVGVARAGCRCFGPGEGEDGDQAEHFLLRAFSLSDARCASSEPSAGYRASRGFARVPLVTRGAVRVNSWPSEMSVINGS